MLVVPSMHPPRALALLSRALHDRPPVGAVARRLWRIAIALALCACIFTVGQTIRRANAGEHRLAFGHDFLPSYTAGLLVREGHARSMYDRQIVQAYETQLIARGRLEMDPRYGPWLNPPFYAWIFEPLAAMPYRTALAVFVVFNLILLAASLYLLRTMLVDVPRAQLSPSSFLLLPSQTSWTTLALLPLLLATSMPFMQAFGHQQNTFISLLILCVAVMQWRQRNAFMAGAIAALLAYKPQHAVLICLAISLCLGWRAAAGAGFTALVLLVISQLTLNGCIEDFLTKVPQIVHELQADPRYNWGRQVTFQSFWRLLIQRDVPGPAWPMVSVLAWSCSAAVAAGVGAAIFQCVRHRHSGVSPDRLIAAIIICSPLIMPYYMDYDLVLLSVPAVLFAAEWLADPEAVTSEHWRLLWAWVALFAVTYINPGFARQFHFNLTVPALFVLAVLHISRCLRSRILNHG
jgi:alpha-1,2-mannosyltransferase